MTHYPDSEKKTQMESVYRGHWLPPEIIPHALWLHHRFTLSFGNT